MMKCTAAQLSLEGNIPPLIEGILGSLIEFDTGVNRIHLTFVHLSHSFLHSVVFGFRRVTKVWFTLMNGEFRKGAL